MGTAGEVASWSKMCATAGGSNDLATMQMMTCVYYQCTWIWTQLIEQMLRQPAVVGLSGLGLKLSKSIQFRLVQYLTLLPQACSDLSIIMMLLSSVEQETKSEENTFVLRNEVASRVDTYSLEVICP